MSNNSHQTVRMDRRQALKAAGAGMLALGFASAAHATPAEVDAAVAKLAKGAAVGDGAGVLKIDLPEIAENGATVPVTVNVSSPMTPDNYVNKIYVLAENNPFPIAISFNLTPANGKAYASTRIRLAKTQNVRIVAVMSNGTVVSSKQQVKVTIGGCGG